MSERNEQARASLDAEMAKIGVKPTETKPKESDEEVEEIKPTKEKEKKDVEKETKERVARDPVKDEDDDVEKLSKRPEKYKPLPEYLSEKHQWKEREKQLLKDIEEARKGSTTKQEKDDDIEAEIKAYAEEAGIDDPASVKKLIALATKSSQSMVKSIKDELEAIKERLEKEEKDKSEKTTEEKLKAEGEQFDKEWKSFEKELTEAFEGLSPEQIAEAKVFMDEMSHSKEWHKYDLSYIFFKNKQDFADAIGTKKFKSPGHSKSQGTVITSDNKNAEELTKLPENPTADDIKKYEKYMGRTMKSRGLAEKAQENL